MHVHDQILLFIKANGPTLPTKVAKAIGSEILIASAHLSDLKSQGKIKLTFLKVGGSPLYYLVGQENMLDRFAAGNMNVKDLAVLERLRERKVLRENESDTLSKVALRGLKDFAVALQVRTENTSEIFWKWHLTSDEETNRMIKQMLGGAQKKETIAVPSGQRVNETLIPSVKKEEMQKQLVEEEKPEPVVDNSGDNVDTKVEEMVAQKMEPEAMLETSEMKEVQVDEDTSALSEPETPKEPVKVETSKKETEPKVDIKEKKDTKDEKNVENVQPKKEKKISKVVKEEMEREAGEILEPTKSHAELEKNTKRPFLERLKEKIVGKKDDELLLSLKDYLQENSIEVESINIVRRNREIDMILRIPCVVGRVTFFAKVKRKKKCDEKDVSSAYMEAQMKKLPLLFLYSDDLSSKAKDLTDSFENMLVTSWD